MCVDVYVHLCMCMHVGGGEGGVGVVRGRVVVEGGCMCVVGGCVHVCVHKEGCMCIHVFKGCMHIFCACGSMHAFACGHVFLSFM